MEGDDYDESSETLLVPYSNLRAVPVAPKRKLEAAEADQPGHSDCDQEAVCSKKARTTRAAVVEGGPENCVIPLTGTSTDQLTFAPCRNGILRAGVSAVFGSTAGYTVDEIWYEICPTRMAMAKISNPRTMVTITLPARDVHLETEDYMLKVNSRYFHHSLLKYYLFI
jgi:hypothetical protein